MDDNDRDNLRFLLTASNETLESWYSKVSPADHEYAALLLAEYNRELCFKMTMLQDDVDDVSVAAEEMKKYRL